MNAARGSFFWRMLLGNVLLIAVLLAVSGAVWFRFTDSESQRHEQLHQKQLVEILARQFEESWSADARTTDERCKQIFRGMPFRITVINADGRVLGDNEADPAGMANHKTDSRPEVMAALRGQSGYDIRPSETMGIPFRYLAEPVRRGAEIVGVVRVAAPVQAVVEMHRFLWTTMLWGAVAAAASALLLGLLLSWLWYRPLGQIVHAADKIAKGNLTFRPRISGSSELLRLGASLNQMRLSLTEQIHTSTVQRENLASVLSNLREGVVALDRERRIVLMNRAAVELLCPGAERVEGQPFQRLVRVSEVMDALETLTDGAVTRQLEIERAGRRTTLNLHVSRVACEDPNGIQFLLVVHDVTDLVRASAIKTEFVANASHELRTPLATIRAAVDSLTAFGPDDRDGFTKCLEILDRHVQRLQDITDDMLDLHLAEQSRRKLLQEDISLHRLAQWCRGQFETEAGNKGLDLRVEGADGEAGFRGDRTLLQLILRNLLDNAVKFTPPRGKVLCGLTIADGALVVRVSDTGIGIPPDLKARVFERFFQVDSARGGGDGTRGTGLGLAIVKHAAERLGAQVQLESQLGKGTTVTVTVPFPKSQ